uniref:Reverse transcriptase domain-containing protein n=1 Tax=Glossina morsitans morsitans TaxID=37546 RepID=A0A1B0FD20_GLOMM
MKQNGDIRICADNKVIINNHLVGFKYLLPRIDEIISDLRGCAIFAKLHIGRLKLKRLPFGVKTAATIFQKTMENLLPDIPNVFVYQDDITIGGKDQPFKLNEKSTHSFNGKYHTYGTPLTVMD